ncbi:MAG: terpene cyclase/mutase family protein, partial [Planctomycetaceae bacterium]|nr:terpene cyclase/mutase family protein [Planctomycetaceae bacterium]
GVAQLILGTTNASPERADTETKFAELIVKGQQPEGHWKPGGQLPAQKRPIQETTAVSTMWMALSLGMTDEKSAESSRQKALDWIKSAPKGETTEWHVARLLLDQQQGDADSISKQVASLRKQQNADGGWGWKAGDPSDALATGQVLYAFAKVNVPTTDEAITQAQSFLIETQQKNGSWLVPGTKRSKKGKPAETANYWGTCWATIGLLDTLPESS